MPIADRFLTALLFSLMAHVLVLFGIHFKPPNPAAVTVSAPPLVVALVNLKSREPPVNARLLAQAHSQGGGDETALDATSPQESGNDRAVDAPRGDLSKTGADTLDQLLQRQAELDRVMLTLRSKYYLLQHDASSSVSGGARGAAAEMARIYARVERDWRALQQRPRRLYLGPQAREHVLARYVENWRLKVEAVGNRNYPEAVRRQRLQGRVLLTVEVRADGQVVAVHLERSSGHPKLDRAAQDIVRLAAPFAPFTAEMRARADIIGITRTWIFSETEGLTSQGY
jgi:protein TonB